MIARKPLFIVAVLTACIWSGAAGAAELATLSPSNWEDYAPRGKEVDAIYGDYALRNDKLVAVVAQPIEGRNANMTTRAVGGALIDLTLRDAQSDQLSAYYVGGQEYAFRLAGAKAEGGLIEAGGDARLTAEGRSVSLLLDGEEVPGRPQLSVQYTLEDGSAHITIETIYTNTLDQIIEIEIVDFVRLDQSRDGLAVEKAGEGRGSLYWLYDKWFGQAYGVMAEGAVLRFAAREGGYAPTRIAYTIRDKDTVTLQPGESYRLVRRIFPSRTLLGVQSIARDYLGLRQTPVTLRVEETTGAAVRDADVTVTRGEESLGWGRTDETGTVRFALPAGQYEARVASLGRGALTVPMDAAVLTEYRAELPKAGYVVVNARDASGAPTPCKVQFYGKDGTEDPMFGPDSGEHGVRNVYYSHTGRFRQDLPPGTYEVIISRGPEYDAVFAEIEIRQGEQTALDATLVRSVQTPGWVSADFHSHSSPSGDNTSSQRGRVLNLLCEHIEFAPCTEHNRIDTYAPHLEALGATRLMATCTGIELTSSPGELNHHNAFPLVHKPRTQDGGAPLASRDPEEQIKRLALWDDGSEKLVQQNHPDMPWLFFDRNNDGKPDDGFAEMPKYMNVIEVHPPEAIFWAPFTDTLPPNATPKSLPRNRMHTWAQLFNLGRGIPGVANTDAHANFHGSGWLRNYIKSSTDDPAAIDTMEMARAAERGQLIMTNGPYLEVNLQSSRASASSAGTAGDTVIAPEGKAVLHIRVQCPNWFDVDRVQVLINGRHDAALNFTRQSHPGFFADGVVKFDRMLPLELGADTHVIVAAIGEQSGFGRVFGRARANTRPVAVSNPIFVDVDGNGFKPSGDTLDAPLVPSSR